MGIALTNKQLLSSFVTYIIGVLPDGLDFCWNWMEIDTSGISRWVDAIIPEVTRPPQRKGSSDEREARFILRVFQKSSGNDLEHWRTVREIVPLLRHQELSIYDYSDSSEPVVGSIRLREVTAENKSRTFNGRGESNNRAQDLSQLSRSNVKFVQILCVGTLQS
jgi:hypothetical protein